MPHSTPLIATIVIGLSLAFLFGFAASRLRISPLIGYLLAGVAVGPFTPGFVADQALAPELAEIGVILLMFGVGLHFSPRDLLAVGAVAVPGAIVQMAVATLLGVGLASILGWSLGAGLVFGLALSVASTVVLLRALQERRLVETRTGRIAVGWLIVEDLAMVLALVLLPALSGLFGDHQPAGGHGELIGAIAITLGKVAAFVAFMLIVGRRVIPWLLHYVAGTGSRELFRLAVLAVALGVAYEAAQLFDVSFALGAFFAGMVLSESELSQQAGRELLPLRDAFAVLFFVSVGMLFDPAILVRDPWAVLATVAIILVGKSAAAFLITLIARLPLATSATVAVSLAQIGEFSFILAGLGIELELLPERGRALILAGAIISLLVNPLLFALLDRLAPRLTPRQEGGERRPGAAPAPAPAIPPTGLAGHDVLVGFGRVGKLVGEALGAAGRPLLVIEDRQDLVDALAARGIATLQGNAASPDLLAAAGLPAARCLIIAIPDGFEAGQIAQQARAANPRVEIVARAHSDAEVEHLRQHGADAVIMGEREIAQAMVAHLTRPGAAAPPEVPGGAAA
jgi:CPA2 family monovalent cation:H+ antiporter-2